MPLRLSFALAPIALLLAGNVAAAPTSHQGLAIEVRGEGRPVLFIPGLNSAAETWHETCEALRPSGVQCHLVQLPGFAGLEPVQEEPWLDAMAERLLSYADQANLQQPVVIGHSLGGVLGMKLALKAPERLAGLVIVDSLPFFPAAQNTAATSEMMTPMATGMRQGMRALEDEAYREQTRMALRGMSNQPERTPTLEGWGLASDRWTTSQAMFELFTVDLREAIAEIRTPTLVLGAWAAYQSFGATRESIGAVFAGQYQRLPGVRIELSDSGYHFLMWDDADWLQDQTRSFLAGLTP